LVTAVIPQGAPEKVEEELFQLLAGVRACLDREQVALVGGHSSEGEELAVGLSVTGAVTPERILRKAGLREGDVLVLTRPLGTGILFAAAMRAQASAAAIETALAEMRRSNRRAAAILAAHGAGAMTDVSGFGLAGHLGEMLAAGGCSARVDLPALPIYGSVAGLARAGMTSTMLPQNLALRGLVDGEADAASLAILFDPQTSGGLLAGIAPDRADACIAALRAEGYAHVCRFGTVRRNASGGAEAARIALLGVIPA
jgi:selenide,water dikinase